MTVTTVTKDNFEEFVIAGEKPVLLLLWVNWCTESKRIIPVFDAVASDFPAVAAGKIDLDAETELKAAFKIAKTPTIVLFKNGELVKKLIGFHDKAGITEFIEENL